MPLYIARQKDGTGQLAANKPTGASPICGKYTAASRMQWSHTQRQKNFPRTAESGTMWQTKKGPPPGAKTKYKQKNKHKHAIKENDSSDYAIVRTQSGQTVVDPPCMRPH
jgi:hypothetical protein